MAKRIFGNTIANRPKVADSSDIFVEVTTGKQYVFEDGAWQDVPYNGQPVDGYVKKTDYATASAAGVIKVGNGLTASGAVLSTIVPACTESTEGGYVLNCAVDSEGAKTYSWDEPALPACSADTAGTYVLKCTVTVTEGVASYAYAWVAEATE